MEDAKSSERETVPVLEHILRNGTLEGLPEEHYSMVASFMDDQLVLCYRNGCSLEVNPLVRDLVQELAAEKEAEDSP